MLAGVTFSAGACVEPTQRYSSSCAKAMDFGAATTVTLRLAFLPL